MYRFRLGIFKSRTFFSLLKKHLYHGFFSGPNVPAPRPSAATSIPSLLHSLQSEWDSLMLESLALKTQYQSTRQELAHALYREDASLRVVARLVKERDQARE